MPVAHDVDADDALFTEFTGVNFRDPGEEEYATFNPDQVDAKFFFKPIQDEVLNLIRKVDALENGGESMLQAMTRSQIQLYTYSTYR